MCLSKLSILLFLGMIVASNTQLEPEDFLAPHNKARAKKGLAPLVWDPVVAAYAQNYAQKRTDCELIHSHGEYGENIAWSTDPNFSAREATALWVDEEPYYDYNNNVCTQGQQCLHYTQVMWKDSVCLGCGYSRCTNGGRFITCNYNPPGNYIGLKPY